jgi:hypothetical protein
MEKKIGNYIIRVKQDTDPFDPREDDNLTTMVCFHRRYKLGDLHDYSELDYDSFADLKKEIIKQENPLIIKPLYLFDHSGITIRTKPFDCRWDSGMVGFVFITKKNMELLGVEDESKLDEYLEAEVSEYDKYLTGDVYSWSIVKVKTCDLGCDHEVLMDASYGHYDEDECMESAMSYYNDMYAEKINV